MDAKKMKSARRRLSAEHDKLVKSINRNRTATQEIKTENTEDEGDLATISHDKALLYNLHEADCVRLRFVQDAIKALDRGREYGECVHCGEKINEKRLLAVPWASLCIRCQEEREAEHVSSRMVLAGLEEETDL